MNTLLSIEQRAQAALAVIRAADMPNAVTLTRASTITSTPIRWLWRGYLARGKLHILAGAPGTGKTTIALAVAATITRGGQWPDGTLAPAGRVLLWSGEDDPADTLVPRLCAAGADLDRVLIVGDTLEDGEPRAFDPARDLAGLELAAAQFDDIALLIADPVVSAVSGDSHKNTEVRRALQPLVNLGQRLGCAVLGISHFSKGTSGRDPTERVTGSVAFGAIARVVLVTAKNEDGTRLLARAKSNIGRDAGGFSYNLEMVDSGGIEASRVQWGMVLEGSARELLGEAESVDTPRDDAADWLADMLAGGEVLVRELRSQAAAAGFSWRTIERAKAGIGIIAEATGKSDGSRGVGHWSWRLKSASYKSANLHSGSGGVNETLAAHSSQALTPLRPPQSVSGGLVADLRGEGWEEEA